MTPGRAVLAALIAADKWLNGKLGGKDYQTISHRLGLAWRGAYGRAAKRRAQFWRWLVNRLFWWQRDHCAESIEEDGR